RFAHLRGVFVYVTVNTLVDNSEMENLAAYLKYLYQAGADAVIVQDLGTAALAREIVPQLPLHASTQMTAHNLEGVKFLAQLGFRRVILARELSLPAIKEIAQGAALLGVEIEVFIHGALCISYSGQCLMSSLIGGRSGNRGRCAQPCRLPYTLVAANGQNVLEKTEAGDYLLSPKDLNTLDILPELLEAGVASLKIEGRMKRAEYVAVVVNAYRRALDSLSKEAAYQVCQQDKKDIAQIFNRDFTTAYLVNRPGKDMMSDRRPNNRGVMIGRVIGYDKEQKTVAIQLEEKLDTGDIIEVWVKVGGRVNIPVGEMLVGGKRRTEAVRGDTVVLPCAKEARPHDRVFKVFAKKLNEKARAAFAKEEGKIPVDVTVDAQEGEGLTVTITDNTGLSAAAKTDFLAERAVNRPLTHESVRKQIERLGTTVFELKNLTTNISGEIMVPVSEINEARRKAAENLAQKRLAQFLWREPLTEKTLTILPDEKKITPRQPALTVNVDTLAKAEAALRAGADLIMFGAENYQGEAISKNDYAAALELTKKSGKKIIFTTPKIINTQQMPEIAALLDFFSQIRPDAVSAANLGVLYLLKETTAFAIHGDYPLNIYNSRSVEFLSSLGLKSLTLSPELNFAQIAAIRARTDIVLETIVHGHLPLMVSEYCVSGSFLRGCAKNETPAAACPPQKYWLQDRTGAKFPVIRDQYCRTHILNAKETSMLPNTERLKNSGIDRIRIEGKYLDAKTIFTVIEKYRDFLAKKIQSGAEIDADENITRGHYFRGVL
ncbi:MAG: U32 family peptidase, partial [Sporomusaceae bacterium]|nr:U32 family peptidase [Sporomusaceae bacterium]